MVIHRLGEWCLCWEVFGEGGGFICCSLDDLAEGGDFGGKVWCVYPVGVGYPGRGDKWG